MSSNLAVVWLYETVRARFIAEMPVGAEPIEFAFGEREPAKRVGKRRIIFVPGDEGDLGELAPARHPGRIPRSLGTLQELVTVYLEAIDTTSVENELLQYAASRLLFDAFWRAVYLAASGSVATRSIRVVDDKLERRLGSALRIVIAIDAMIPDVPVATVLPTASENITTVLSVDETNSTEDAP